MKKIIFALSTLALLSCSKESVEPLNEENVSFEETTQTRRYQPTDKVFKQQIPVTEDLMAGQFTDVGSVVVSMSGTDLVVAYYIDEANWIITDSHLFVGDCGTQPMNGAGNPQIGHFPYKEVHSPGVVEFYYDVADMTYGCVAAHAVVVNTVTGQEETAWAGNIESDYVEPYSDNANSWATIFGFTL